MCISTWAVCWCVFLVLIWVSSGVDSMSQFRSFSFSERDNIKRFFGLDTLAFVVAGDSSLPSPPSEAFWVSADVLEPPSEFWENRNKKYPCNVNELYRRRFNSSYIILNYKTVLKKYMDTICGVCPINLKYNPWNVQSAFLLKGSPRSQIRLQGQSLVHLCPADSSSGSAWWRSEGRLYEGRERTLSCLFEKDWNFRYHLALVPVEVERHVMLCYGCYLFSFWGFCVIPPVKLKQ